MYEALGMILEKRLRNKDSIPQKTVFEFQWKIWHLLLPSQKTYEGTLGCAAFEWKLVFFSDLLVDHHTGWPFWLVPPRKVLSIELVPSNREKLQSSAKMAKIPTKKVKVHIRVCQTFTFCYNLAEKLGSDRLWLGISLFFSRDIAIVLFSHFSILGGTSSILRTFLVWGPSGPIDDWHGALKKCLPQI